jgi:hypothetical protein
VRAAATSNGDETNETNKDVTNVNQYVSSMLAVSLGLKLADSIRRVCMYTKAKDEQKEFYAVFRGIFPIHELCGTVTALGLARRDVLGQQMPLWKLLLPAAIIHAMANFRGMKVRETTASLVTMNHERNSNNSIFVCVCVLYVGSLFSSGIRPLLGPKCSYRQIS